MLLESQKVWLAHARVYESLIKACLRPGGGVSWALHELELHEQWGRQGVPGGALDRGSHYQRDKETSPP